MRDYFGTYLDTPGGRYSSRHRYWAHQIWDEPRGWPGRLINPFVPPGWQDAVRERLGGISFNPLVNNWSGWPGEPLLCRRYPEYCGQGVHPWLGDSQILGAPGQNPSAIDVSNVAWDQIF